jgi:hypothetical protein
MITDLKAPFPYFGGKSTVADVIWAALGQPKHYIEPFAGSCAILLNRPDYNPIKHMETINDKDGYVANVWRSLQMEPDAVAKVCDWPVNHADLNARRRYLLKNAELLQNLCDDPEWHDVTMAGYWIWAASCWIGSGLTRPGAMPDTTNAKGVHKISTAGQRPHLDRPSEGGKGVHRKGISEKRPHLAHDGRGVAQLAATGRGNQIPLLNHEAGVCRRPCYGASGAHGVHKTTLTSDPDPEMDVRDPYTPGLYTWFRQLSERLRRVRVVCGDWKRVCGGDWQDDRGTCGMAFDPPYSEAAGRDKEIYHEESLVVADDVREWCRERGDRKTYRIVLCGYLEEHESLLNDGWTVHRWSAHGGFANRGNGKTRGAINRHKEALFFSPYCHSSGLQRFMDLGMLSEEVEVPA